jgi:hypothetical protein
MWDARSIEERVVLGIALCVDYVLVLAVCVGHEQWARVTAGPSLHSTYETPPSLVEEGI